MDVGQNCESRGSFSVADEGSIARSTAESWTRSNRIPTGARTPRSDPESVRSTQGELFLSARHWVIVHP
jgi:hypothetical protein